MSTLTTDPDVQTIPAAAAKLAPGSPAPYVYRPDQGLPLPPETTDARVLGRLAAIRGKTCVQDLGAAIAVLDSELKTRYRAMADVGKIAEHYPVVLDVLARRQIYGARLTALKRALGMKPEGAVPPAELPDLLRIVGQGHETDIRTRLDVVATEIKAELQETDEALQAIERIASDETRYRTEAGARGCYRADRLGRLNLIARDVAALIALVHPDSRTRRQGREVTPLAVDVDWLDRAVRETVGDLEHEWPQDGLLRRLDSALTRRQSLQTRLAALQQDTSRATSVVSTGVWDALKSAGGKDAVIGGILAAQHLANSIPPALEPAMKAIRRLEQEHEHATDQFSRVSLSLGDRFAPLAAEKMRAKQMELAASLQQARAALVTQQTELAVSLVDQAISGIEPARGALQAIADQAPEAFAPGLGSALAASRFEAAAAAELADALQSA